MRGDIERTAIISDCGRYRYALGRRWDARLPTLHWIMLNPSKADAERDDLTITKCMGFAERLGYGSINVVNLFALRATDPRELWSADDPVGPINDRVLKKLGRTAGESRVIAAWGVSKNALHAQRAEQLARLLSGRLCALGTTKDGSPRHPSRLGYDRKPTSWS